MNRLRGVCPPIDQVLARMFSPDHQVALRGVADTPGRDACVVCGHATMALRVLCGCCLDRLAEADRLALFDLWDSGEDWTVYNARACELGATLGPCPRCSVCGADVRLHLRADGEPLGGDPRVVTHSRPPMRAVCRGSNRPPLAEGAKTLLEQVEP